MIGDETDVLETLPPDLAGETLAPDFPLPPPEVGRDRGSRGSRGALLAGAGATLALVGATVGVMVATSGSQPRPRPHPHLVRPVGPQALSPTRILAQDGPGTVQVIARTAPGSLLEAMNHGSDLLDRGSGWVYDPSKGLIVTNAHVVDAAASVQVGVEGQGLVDGTVVGEDLVHDIALLQVPANALTGLAGLQRADSATVQQGESVVALGFPDNGGSDFLNTKLQITSGDVSAMGDNVTINTDAFDQPNDNGLASYPGMLQTSAPIGPGSSGGPLVDDHGQLVGMDTGGAGGGNSVGYAIPVSTLDQVIPTLAAGHSIAYLGFGVEPMSSPLDQQLQVNGGLIITSVLKDGSADQAGLTGQLDNATSNGDLLILYQVNDTNVVTAQEYHDALRQAQSGEPVKLSLAEVDPSNGKVIGGGTLVVNMP